jgi:hypothetical protein
VSLNGYKITSLANATTGTDALNQDSGDSRYYLNTTTLDNITTPTASLDMNNQKIVSIADATAAQDAYVLGQDLRY